MSACHIVGFVNRALPLIEISAHEKVVHALSHSFKRACAAIYCEYMLIFVYEPSPTTMPSDSFVASESFDKIAI